MPATPTVLDRVIAQQMAGQLDDALITLAAAARLDPDILDSTVGANLAMTLTSLPRDQAIAAVRARGQTLRFDTGSGLISSVNAQKTGVWRGIYSLINSLLGLVALLLVLIVIFALIGFGTVPLANRLFSSLKSTASQYSGSQSNVIAASLAQLANGQSLTPAQLSALTAQFQQLQTGHFNLNSPEFRATIIAGLLSSLGQTSLKTPPFNVVLRSAISGGLALFGISALITLVVYGIGLLIGGRGGVLFFFQTMTGAYLKIYGLVLIGLGCWLLVLIDPALSADLQTVLIIGGLLLIAVSALFGVRFQIGAAAKGHRFGRFRGCIAVTIGSLLVTVLIAIPALTAILKLFR